MTKPDVAPPQWGVNVIQQPVHVVRTVVSTYSRRHEEPPTEIIDGRTCYFMGGYWLTAYQDLEVSEHD